MKHSFLKKSAALLASAILLSAPASGAEIIRLSTYVNEVDIRHEGFENSPNSLQRKPTAEWMCKYFPPPHCTDGARA